MKLAIELVMKLATKKKPKKKNQKKKNQKKKNPLARVRVEN